MFDIKRAVLVSYRDNAKSPEERELAIGLLEGYDSGQLDVYFDVATGEPQFTLNAPN